VKNRVSFDKEDARMTGTGLFSKRYLAIWLRNGSIPPESYW